MNGTPPSRRVPLIGAVVLSLALGTVASASDLDREPINYAKAPAENAVTRLQQRLTEGKARLSFEEDRGYAKSVLAALEVPVSSQVLVFSKTSLQRERITPKTPRAIYFNDDVYVGFCLRGDVMEFAAADPQLGTVFYTLDQEPADKPRFTRHADNCLICHGSPLSRGLPGHVVRSVYTDAEGLPILSAGSHRTDHTSPFKERWGGWYVTGTHGPQTHMGNWILQKKADADMGFDAGGQNRTSLKDLFTTSFYLSPHSDIVALMVLEHQTGMHNHIARATLETRMALHYEQELNKSLGEPPTHHFDSTASRIKSAGDGLVKYLLFSDECQLTGRVEGTTAFAKDFAARGPFDKQGRTLREFDLQTRLFKHRCSYLIYSEAFDKMPAAVKEYTYQRLFDVLTGKDESKDFAHLPREERTAILEILRDTKKDLPAYWK
jgi:hypothetical protein